VIAPLSFERLHERPDPDKWFWSRVDKAGPIPTNQPGLGPCWLWTGPHDRRGYGFLYVGSRRRYRTHRVAYALAVGPIPDGLGVLHHCDTPPCCNPAHLFLGTDADNVADRDAKGRQARGDRNGKRLHPERWPRLAGEQAPRAKLTAEQVAAIRASYVPRLVSHRALARAYGVSGATIGALLRGESWRDDDA
jgi:hypothetical protein